MLLETCIFPAQNLGQTPAAFASTLSNKESNWFLSSSVTPRNTLIPESEGHGFQPEAAKTARDFAGLVFIH